MNATVTYATAQPLRPAFAWVKVIGDVPVSLKTKDYRNLLAPQDFANNLHVTEVKSDELQKAKDDNFIDYRDLPSPTNSAVLTKML
jgi:hypothetical protein